MQQTRTDGNLVFVIRVKPVHNRQSKPLFEPHLLESHGSWTAVVIGIICQFVPDPEKFRFTVSKLENIVTIGLFSIIAAFFFLASIRNKQQRGDAIKPSETGQYRRIEGHFFPSRPVPWCILVIRLLIAFIYKHIFELTSPKTYESRLEGRDMILGQAIRQETRKETINEFAKRIDELRKNGKETYDELDNIVKDMREQYSDKKK